MQTDVVCSNLNQNANMKKIIQNLFQMPNPYKIFLLIIGISILSAITHCTKIDSGSIQSNNPWQKQSTSATLQKSIFITQSSNSSYFYYNVYTQNNQILIKILNKDLTVQTFTFAKINYKIQFRTAYDRYIIVQQIDTKKSTSVSYWVIEIVTTQSCHSLSIFAVDSLSDSDGFKFENAYSLTEVIQFDQVNNLLYVVLDSITDFDVYKLDLSQSKTVRKLKIVNYFYYSQIRRETIVGGNSRVLVEATNDQFWVDQRKPITLTIASTYKKIKIEDLTSLRIYTSGSRAYNFISSYFQYVSVSKDMLKMNAFVYYGYNKTKPIGQGSLSSYQKPIKFYSDDESYFVAVADNDVYYTLVYWNATICDYVVYSSTLSKTVKDKKLWPQYIKSFSEALIIVLYDLKFYILTQDALYVENGISINKISLKKKIQNTDKLEHVLFKQMLKYENMQKNVGGSGKN